MHKTSYKDILYSTGIQPIFYNRHRWSITVENCGSLCCTPVIYIILYINLKKVPFKGSEHSLSAGYRRTMLTSDSLWTYNPPLTPLGERFDPRTLHLLGGELRCRWPTTSWSEISQWWEKSYPWYASVHTPRHQEQLQGTRRNCCLGQDKESFHSEG